MNSGVTQSRTSHRALSFPNPTLADITLPPPRGADLFDELFEIDMHGMEREFLAVFLPVPKQMWRRWWADNWSAKAYLVKMCRALLPGMMEPFTDLGNHHPIDCNVFTFLMNGCVMFIYITDFILPGNIDPFSQTSSLSLSLSIFVQ